MSYEPGSPFVSERPDKPLVVKCDYNARRQKLSFTSARYCSYDGLKEKIEKHFALSAQHFAIQWKDHDGEENYIQDEVSLDEAIEYYHSGDEGSVRSSGSAFASRSSSRHHKITMFVQVRVEYDGPSLSDTSSLASREDSPEESQFSFSPAPGELSIPQLDDDAVTVSSKDTRHRSRQGCRDPSLFKKLLTGGTRSQAAGSSSQNSLPRKLSRSRMFGIRSRASYTDEDPTGRSIRDNTNGPSSDNPANTERAYTNDPSAVFARLKLEEQLSSSLPHEHSSIQTDRRKAWLQEQSNQTKASLGVVPAPSTSDDAFSLNTSSPLSDGVPDMDILLQKDERGKYYYNYTGSGSSESAGDTEYEVVTNESPPNNDVGIPHELLIPEEVTGCDECGCVLDQMRYICTTCGEKTPTSRAALEVAAAAVIGKGKSREFPNYVHHYHGPSTEYNLEEPTYPPHAHRVHVTASLLSYSPTQTVLGRRIGSQTTLVPSSSSGSSSSTARAGYELCNMCFTKVGVDHSLVGGVDAPSSPTSPQTASELAIARRSAPKQNGQLRHAFVEQVWGFHGWQVIEQDEMSHHCSGCQSVLSGNRYKCGICDNFTICRACFSEVHNIHPIHPFLEMEVKPASRTRSRSEVSHCDGNVDEPSLKHPGVQCFNCQQDIVGARFRCVDCMNINIDICSNCETAGLPGNLDASDGGHSSSHIMLKIPVPLNMHEVQNVSQRAHGLSHGRDRADLRGVVAAEALQPRPLSASGTNALTAPPNLQSFNLCSDCEIKSYRVHDPMHTFLKIHRPVDIPGPLESEFPIIPILAFSDIEIPLDPHQAAPLRTYQVTQQVISATSHMPLLSATGICGVSLASGTAVRSAAKDLCADCEVLDTHDGTHLFVVFKAPVDMQAFRHFADLENPAGSPPVLHGNIYYPRH
ncbi:hypothetical protein EDB89DRAFT_2069194 [Lactarius sanguifluus]|nr:hypothetical protein EDB89DRAFT_2069194 [Lactarius sanguifluus]